MSDVSSGQIRVLMFAKLSADDTSRQIVNEAVQVNWGVTENQIIPGRKLHKQSSEKEIL